MVRCDVRLGWAAGDLEKRPKKNEKVVELWKLRYHELKVDFFFCFFVCRQLRGDGME